MSEHEPLPGDEELPIKKYLDTSRQLITKVKSFEFKSFFQGLLVFSSIIFGYLLVEVTHQHRNYFQKVTRIRLNQQKTLAQMFLLLSLYLIFWNLVAKFLKNRALKPPQKVDQYEELPQEQTPVVITLPPLPNGELYAHEIIQNSLDATIYFFLLLVSVLSYAYFNQPKRPDLPSLVSIDRVNYLCIWFLAGNLFTLLGDFLFKVTKVRQYRALGVTIKLLVGALALGLANGLNTFIFI